MYIRVAALDDDKLFLSRLRKLLDVSDAIQCVGCFQLREAVLKDMVALKPDVVLVGLSMPDLSGFDFVRLLLGALPSTRVIMISACVEEGVVCAAWSGGALGYLLQPTLSGELVQAVLAVMSGGAPMSAQVSRSLLARHLKHSLPADSHMMLTPRERQIMERIVRGESDKEIAAGLGVGAGTIHTHLLQMYKKYGVHSRQEMVQKNLSIDGRRLGRP